MVLLNDGISVALTPSTETGVPASRPRFLHFHSQRAYQPWGGGGLKQTEKTEIQSPRPWA